MELRRTEHAKAYFNLLKTAGWIEEQIKEALKPHRLTHAQLNVLYMLAESDPEPRNAGDIRRGILVSKPDVTRLLDRLIEKDLIYRETCPNNRRKIDIYLTDSGRNVFWEAHRTAKAAVGEFFAEKISEQEALNLKTIMKKIRS